MSTSSRLSPSQRAARRTWRLIMFTAFLSLLCIALVQVTLNSAARAAPSKAQPASRELPGAIQDDPTAAPDLEESADNNVTFPVDI